MSEYVKIKRRLYDELVETKAKYITLCQMLESMQAGVRYHTKQWMIWKR